MLLNLANGTLDLQTGQLRAHAPRDLLTRVADTVHNPTATCPRWESFLSEIMDCDVEMIEFIQRAIGYSLTGLTREQCMFFLYGSGANGKSTFTNILMALLGEYRKKARTETLLIKSRGSDSINNDIAALAGAILVIAAEMPAGRRLNESLVKDLTSGDPITARFLRKEFFTFTPVFKLWMYGNHKPQIAGTDDGIWRRLRLIPFEVTIPKADQDKKLVHKLLKELPGILNWALEGLASWRENGLHAPQKVQDATNIYRADMDVLQAFIDECCLVSPTASIKYKSLYAAYQQWASESGEEILSMRAFSSRLDREGYANDRGSGNVALRRGIALRDSSATS